MTAFGIVADDLTGAFDVGGAFAAVGRRVIVDLGRGTTPRATAADVVVIDAGLRDAPFDEAASGIANALERLRIAGAEPRMLKVDSTLRGPFREMLEAVLAATDARVAVVAPAFPEHGRCLVGGRLRVRGEDAGIDLVTLLRAGTGARILSVSSRDLMPALERAHADASGTRHVLVMDAESVGDMGHVAAAWLADPNRSLLVGSAGIARHLVTIGPLARDSARSPETLAAEPAADTWYLLVAGSPTDTTRLQLEALRIARPQGSRPKLVVRRSAPSRTRDDGQAAAGLAEEVGALAAAGRLFGERPSGMVLVGGDTATRVLDALDCGALDILGEVEPGVPFGLMRGGAWDGLPIVTKAGSFGSEMTLVNAVDFLTAGPVTEGLGAGRTGTLEGVPR